MIKHYSQIEKVKEARALLREKMNDHGLTEWKTRIGGAYRRLGMCSYKEKVIELSEQFVLAGTQEQILDTIMHEIAHALVGPGYGHGRVWKAKARELGATAKSASKSVNIEQRYVAHCQVCSKQYGMMKQTSSMNRSYCGVCTRHMKRSRYATSEQVRARMIEIEKYRLKFKRNSKFESVPRGVVFKKDKLTEDTF